MKRKYIILLMLPVVLVMFALQSCNPKDNGYYVVYHAFTQATDVAPLDKAVLHLPVGTTTVDLTWASTNKDGDSPLANVYFGTSATPPLYKADSPGLKLTVPVVVGTTYYWSITMVDAHGVYTYGPVWSFYVYDPVTIFTGSFKADEPAEAYSYTVSFVKTGANTIQTSNYWNSGWAATFTLDFTKNTYTMASTIWTASYSGIESGTIDQTTGKMVGNYSIFYNGSSAPPNGEVGVHTYTRQ